MNEKVFIVCVELNNNVAKQQFEGAIGTLGSWTNIMTGVYAVQCNAEKKSDEVRSILSTALFSQGKIFVIKSSIDAAWSLDQEAASWLMGHI